MTDGDKGKNSSESAVVKIILAILVFLGLAIPAAFANWDKIFPKPDQPVSKPSVPAARPETASSVPSVPIAPSNQDPSTFLPERLLTEYVQSLTERNFSALARIYPGVNRVEKREWLQGTSKKAPIATVQIVGQPKRIAESTDEVTLRATVRYCRQNESGSEDIKNYRFVQKEGVWQLDSESAAEKVVLIQC